MQNLEQKTITSMEVAEMVEKGHNKLLRDIRTYEEQLGQAKIGQSDFFVESTYKNSQNKSMPCYLVTKKGCEFIAHKMTGIKGTEFTAKYINRFHDMEEIVQKPMSAMQLMELQFEALKEVKDDLSSVNNDLQEFKQELPLLGVDMDEIQRAKNRKVVPLLGGKDSSAYHDNSVRNKVYRDLESQIKREFGVFSYKAIPRNQVSHVKDMIEAYELPMCLANEVRMTNGQGELFQ